jgi:uncharacterized membrane protein YedE/YeeE
MLFGAGWSVACTCPGPVAAMIGEGRIGGAAVALGIAAGALAQPTLGKLLTMSAGESRGSPGL